MRKTSSPHGENPLSPLVPAKGQPHSAKQKSPAYPGEAPAAPGRSLAWGYALALASTVLSASCFITVKYAVHAFNVETFTVVWTASAALYTLLAILAVGHARKLAIPSGSAWKIFLLGATTGAGMIFSWGGLALLSPSFAALLYRIYPVIAVTMSILFLKEKVEPAELVAGVVMMAGGLLCVGGSWEYVGAGVTLLFISFFTDAVQMILAKSVAGEIEASIMTFYRAAIASLLVAAWTLFKGNMDFNVEASYWMVTLAGAFLAPFAAVILFFQSLKHIELSRATMVGMTQPFFVIPLAWFFMGDFPTTKELAGGMVILAGGFWLARVHYIRRRDDSLAQVP